jgi:hypothetical protein
METEHLVMPSVSTCNWDKKVEEHLRDGTGYGVVKRCIFTFLSVSHMRNSYCSELTIR